ncbi:MAG TPA: arylsulfatase [Dongiaceae bacterium]|nr:arylsulfatase [Dongiaceae bacterium]
MKRIGFQLLTLGLMGVGLLAGATRLMAAPAPRPNIVLILADDLGYSDIGCFGSEIATPKIDHLAATGVALTQFYNQARCCPTRATLMTGRYPHQVGIGDMIDAYAAADRAAAASPAYQDHLSTNSPTMAEILRAAGYRTLMCGKWHLGKRPEEWPVHRGFDRSFVQINGAMNYFGGNSGDGPRDPMALDDKPYVPPHDGFYSTDAFTDHAIEFMEEAVKQHAAQPFFLYLPYNASHWPLMAPEADIAKYKGKYDQGWQAIRQERLAKMIKLGIVPAGQDMAPMDRGRNKPWDQLTAAQRQQWARRMEVYAAQTEHLDTQIGRVLAELRQLGVESNTLVIFLSDNGGAAEDPNGGDKTVPIGDRDSFRGYARPWATVSNTPWRRHKVTAYEGGISTPLLARWPAGIPTASEGTYVREPGHIIDLLPTFMELAGAKYPGDGSVKPEGQSILPMLQGGHGVADRTFCWEHEGNRAIRKGKWKLVTLGNGSEAWELYDLATDRTESHNLAATQPEVVQELAAAYDAWAKRCGVVPWDEIKARRAAAREKK